MDPVLPLPPLPSSVRALVLFDAECPLCVSLAHWSRDRTGEVLIFRSWQSYCADPQSPMGFSPLCQGSHPEQLVLIKGIQVRTGAEAWGDLLKIHPSLRELGWLARQLGFESEAAAYLGRAAGWLRSSLCRACPKPPLR